MPAAVSSTCGTPSRLGDRLERVAGRVLVGDVEPLTVGPHAVLVGDRLRRVLDGVEQVEQGDVRALGGQGSSDGQADAACATRDDGGLAGEVGCPCVSPSFVGACGGRRVRLVSWCARSQPERVRRDEGPGGRARGRSALRTPLVEPVPSAPAAMMRFGDRRGRDAAGVHRQDAGRDPADGLGGRAESSRGHRCRAVPMSSGGSKRTTVGPRRAKRTASSSRACADDRLQAQLAGPARAGAQGLVVVSGLLSWLSMTPSAPGVDERFGGHAAHRRRRARRRPCPDAKTCTPVPRSCDGSDDRGRHGEHHRDAVLGTGSARGVEPAPRARCGGAGSWDRSRRTARVSTARSRADERPEALAVAGRVSAGSPSVEHSRFT